LFVNEQLIQTYGQVSSPFLFKGKTEDGVIWLLEQSKPHHSTLSLALALGIRFFPDKFLFPSQGELSKPLNKTEVKKGSRLTWKKSTML
tara:strand:+ start:254 stop:520 length:267 start_codon:yes stop_codon:yes gene_type:complete